MIPHTENVLSPHSCRILIINVYRSETVRFLTRSIRNVGITKVNDSPLFLFFSFSWLYSVCHGQDTNQSHTNPSFFFYDLQSSECVRTLVMETSLTALFPGARH